MAWQMAVVPEVQSRQNKNPITDDECRTLAITMLKPEVNGNLASAARILGIPYNRANKIAGKDVYLRALQLGVNPSALVPSEADTLNRDPMSPAAVEEAKALIKQERLLANQDWKSLGISEEMAEKMVNFEKFARLPLAHSILTTHGGLMSGYARLTAIFDRYADELEKRTLPSEEKMVDGEAVPRDEGDVERDWVYTLVSISAERRAVYAQLQKGRIQLLKAQQLAKELNKGKTKPDRPGGPPILVQAQPGSTVHLHGEGEPAQ